MEILNITKKQFENLKPLELSQNIFNTEAQMYIIPEKNKWKTIDKILKQLYNDCGEYFNNKVYTINELINNKSEINIEELIIPERLVAVDNKISGFVMPFVPNMNFQDVLNSKKFSLEQKVSYLKEIGEILEKIKKLRKYKKVQDFYLNDIHENNFILNNQTGKINVVDLDSSKISNNLTAPSKYLTSASQLSLIQKYTPIKDENLGASYKVDENTEIYCYIVMILNFFYGDNIGKISIADYYNYLEYLLKIGVSKEFLDKLAYIYTGHVNENPYEYLEELIPYYGKSHKIMFDIVRKK